MGRSSPRARKRGPSTAQPYVLEPPLTADFAFVKAWIGDRDGNLVYRQTARNFNPVMATAAEVTIAEVEQLVEPGDIDPDHVVTPGIFVRHILQGAELREAHRETNRQAEATDTRTDATTNDAKYTKKTLQGPSCLRVFVIAFRVCEASVTADMSDIRERIVKRVARELKDGDYVNLGIGMPTLVANHIPPGVHITLHSENGLLGIGPYPTDDGGRSRSDQRRQGDRHRDAGLRRISAAPTRSRWCAAATSTSRCSARCRSIRTGNLANWMIPGKMVKGMGGAMDLVAGAQRVIIAMEHTTKDGGHKILKQCTLPLTGLKVVHLIVTELRRDRRHRSAGWCCANSPKASRSIRSGAATGATLVVDGTPGLF